MMFADLTTHIWQRFGTEGLAAAVLQVRVFTIMLLKEEAVTAKPEEPADSFTFSGRRINY
jgi:hypothetical protein